MLTLFTLVSAFLLSFSHYVHFAVHSTVHCVVHFVIRAVRFAADPFADAFGSKSILPTIAARKTKFDTSDDCRTLTGCRLSLLAVAGLCWQPGRSVRARSQSFWQMPRTKRESAAGKPQPKHRRHGKQGILDWASSAGRH